MGRNKKIVSSSTMRQTPPSGRQNWRFDKIGYSGKTSHREELSVHDLLQHLASAGEITKQGK